MNLLHPTKKKVQEKNSIISDTSAVDSGSGRGRAQIPGRGAGTTDPILQVYPKDRNTEEGELAPSSSHQILSHVFFFPQAHLQWNVPTVSWDGHKELPCSEQASSAAGWGKRFGKVGKEGFCNSRGKTQAQGRKSSMQGKVMERWENSLALHTNIPPGIPGIFSHEDFMQRCGLITPCQPLMLQGWKSWNY